MALRLNPFGRNNAPQAPQAPAAAPPAPQTSREDFYVHGDALPVPDTEEKNSDSIWALFTDAPEDIPEPVQQGDLLPNILQTESDAEQKEDFFQATMPATLAMDLPDLLKGRE